MRNVFAGIIELLTPAQRRRALVMLGLMFVGMFLEALGVGLMIPLIGLLTQDDLTRYPALAGVLDLLGNPSQQRLIVMAMLGLTAVYLIKNVFLAFLAYWQTAFAVSIQVALSQRLFTIYLRQPYTFHLQRNSSELFHKINSEVGMFTATVDHAMLLTTESVVFLGIAALILSIEPLGALIIVVVLGSAAWAFQRVTRLRISQWGRLRRHHSELSVRHLMQGLGGAKDVKLLGRETEFLEQFGIHNFQEARISERLTVLQKLPRLWLELLAVSGLAVLVVTMLAQGRSPAAIVPVVGGFAVAAFRLAPSINRMLNAHQMLRFRKPVLDSLREEFALPAPEPVRRTGATTKFASAVALQNVTFWYPAAATRALDDISVSITHGEFVGIIGPSGSGKTTLVDTLLGLLTPTKGRVVVDGRDIREDVRAWQDQIGYVSQSIYLTDDTLRRNVAFGIADDQIDNDAVQRALRAAQLADFIATLPAGVETYVGERGIRLSGGQRQRIGIARALYHEPAVLVLDEATSALDTAAEQSVMQAVSALHGEKTVVIVAHRLSTVENCDRLYRLEDGMVVAQGTPAELLPHLATFETVLPS